jgi:hypothetical protein
MRVTCKASSPAPSTACWPTSHASLGMGGWQIWMQPQKRRGWAARELSNTTGGVARQGASVCGVGGGAGGGSRQQISRVAGNCVVVWLRRRAGGKAQLFTSAPCPPPGLLCPACRKNPLPADAVLIDEASMLNLPLAAALIDALRPKCQLVLVGDVDQLPPVGECILCKGRQCSFGFLPCSTGHGAAEPAGLPPGAGGRPAGDLPPGSRVHHHHQRPSRSADLPHRML